MISDKSLYPTIDSFLKQTKKVSSYATEYNVDLYKDKLCVRVKYDYKLVVLFREHFGTWSKVRKAWEFPSIVGPKLFALNLGSWSPEALEYSTFDDVTFGLSKAVEGDGSFRGLLREPRKHQVAGIEYLIKTRRTFLADALGLGKTYQSIAAIEQMEDFPCLIVCETSMKSQWRKEIETTVNRSSTILKGRKPSVFTEPHFVIVNQDIVAAWEQTLCKYRFKSLIVDESSNFASNSQRSKSVRRIARTVTGSRFCLSATAVINGNQVELANQLDIIGQAKLFGGKTALRKMNVDDLNAQLRSRCYLRRTTEDVYGSTADTKMYFDKIYVDVNDTEYRKCEADTIKYIGSIAAQVAKDSGLDVKSEQVRAMVKASAGLNLVKMMKLRQLAGEAKVEVAIDYVKKFLESTLDSKLIVFAFYEKVISGLVAGLGCEHIAGDTPMKDRARIVESFQTDPNVRVIVLNTRSAGKGLTLSAAHHVLFVETEWSQSMMRQCLGRAHYRTDNPHSAKGLILMMDNSIDVHMSNLREAKAGVSDMVVDGELSEHEFDEGSTMSDFMSLFVDLVLDAK